MRALALLLTVLSLPAVAEQQLASYPGATLTRIGEDLVIDGEYYRLAYFVTKDSIRDVAAHFARKFAEEGVSTMVDGNVDREAVVSAFYTREGLVRSIVLLPHGKKTLGFSVMKDLWVREPKAKGSPLPPLEGALWSGDVRSRDAGMQGFQRTTLVKKSLTDTRNEVIAKLKSEGWEQLSEQDVRREGDTRRRVILHGRGGEELATTLQESEPGVTVVSQSLLGKRSGK